MDGSREKWKPNLKVIKAMIQYVIKTGRFQPKATVSQEIEAVEEGDVTGESDDDVGRTVVADYTYSRRLVLDQLGLNWERW